MGGEGQPQTQAALVTRMVDFGLSPHDAVAAPHWLYGRSWGAPVNNLRIEGRFAPKVATTLQHMGHDVGFTGGFSDLMGHAGPFCATEVQVCSLEPQTHAATDWPQATDTAHYAEAVKGRGLQHIYWAASAGMRLPGRVFVWRLVQNRAYITPFSCACPTHLTVHMHLRFFFFTTDLPLSIRAKTTNL